MNGKRAKSLRRLCKVVFEESVEQGGPAEQNNGKIKVGRIHGGPAFGRFAYPPSQRWVKRGDFDVLEISTEYLRAAAGELETYDLAETETVN